VAKSFLLIVHEHRIFEVSGAQPTVFVKMLRAQAIDTLQATVHDPFSTTEKINTNT
jgi:hypothetical protein